MKNQMNTSLTAKDAKEMTPASTGIAQCLGEADLSASKGHDVKVTKRSISQTILGISTVLCAAQLMIACQPKSGSGGSGPAPATNPAPNLGGNGTGDSTGGNGVNGKVFEAYAVDVTKTPEWINHIAPIERHLKKLEGDSDEYSKMFSLLARTKTWFIAPITLEQIEKSRLGVAFIREPVQQLVLHDDKSIWINSTLYNAPENDEKARATLQMHETVMHAYLLKFMPARELCLLAGGDSITCNEEVLSRLGDPEPKRDLNQDDYKSIRAMTDFLMTQGTSISSVDVLRNEFYRHGFDKRLFGAVQIKSTPSVSADVPNGILFSQLGQAKILGRFPMNCGTLTNPIKPLNCDVNAELIRNGTNQMLKLTIKIESSNGVSEYVAYAFEDDKALPKKIYSTVSRMDSRTVVYSQSIGPALKKGAQSINAGDDFFHVNVGWSASIGSEITEIELIHLRATSDSKKFVTRPPGFIGAALQFDFGTPSKVQRTDIILTNLSLDRKVELETSTSSGGQSATVEAHPVVAY